jgi:Kef-type K+ transport system membrane component KefB
MDTILTTFVAAVALGIAGQVIAERFQLPAILPLLLLGILCGPGGIGQWARRWKSSTRGAWLRTS